MEEIEIEIYETATGKRPFEVWLEGLKEIHTKARISMRLDRLKLGNFGDCKTLQEGVSELRIHYGQELEFIMGKLVIESFYCFVVVTKVLKIETLIKQKKYLNDYQSRSLNNGKK